MIARITVAGAFGLTMLAACEGVAPAADVNLTLRDTSIQAEPTTAQAGSLAIVGSNDGSETHEFELFRVPAGVDALQLPVEDNVASDDSLELIEEREDIPPGTFAELRVELDAGTYAVICNLPGHYARGMRTTFTVG
jgi:uncharacterized cupredoxin-like copper-binding protein